MLGYSRRGLSSQTIRVDVSLTFGKISHEDEKRARRGRGEDEIRIAARNLSNTVVVFNKRSTKKVKHANERTNKQCPIKLSPHHLH